MKACLIVATSCLFSFDLVWGQDPTFRLPETRRSSADASPNPIAPSETVKSASVINDMNVVDNTTPIRTGDLISLKIVEDRKEAIQLRVGVTGDINAPHIGIVRAAGRTCRELAFSMKTQLEKSLYNTATVIVGIDMRPEDIGGRGPRTGIREEELDVITVFGQVIRQGKYELPINEDMTISQAILLSGGFAQFANPKKVKLVRKTPQGNKTILVNVDQVMRRGNLDKDIFLRRGDVIIVDEKTVNF